jgi:hypothetical protein
MIIFWLIIFFTIIVFISHFFTEDEPINRYGP